jgi:hypothetical protein
VKSIEQLAAYRASCWVIAFFRQMETYFRCQTLAGRLG